MINITKKIHFTIVDISIILIFLTVLSFCLSKYLNSKSLSDSVEPYHIIMEIDLVKSGLINSIKEGDIIYSKTGEKLGKVTGIEIEPQKAEYHGSNGSVNEIVYEDLYKLTLNVTVENTADNISGFSSSIGERMIIRTFNFSGEALLVSRNFI